MGELSKIAWTDHTFNPWWGCVKVSPACDHCYAETFSKRTGHQVWGKDAPRRFFGDQHWAEPLKWNREAEKANARKRVFCGSMCDVMEDRIELDAWRDKLYTLIYKTPHLDWLLLTKRPQNFRRFLPPSMIANPLSNVWLMTTVESPEYLWRAECLQFVPAAIRGLSIEPLLGPIDLTRYVPQKTDPFFHNKTINLLTGDIYSGEKMIGFGPKVNWVIVGGESGPGARPMNLEWAESIRQQCQKTGTKFFMKQMGGVRDKREALESIPQMLRIREFPNEYRLAEGK